MKRLKTDLEELGTRLPLAKEMLEMTVSHYQAACKHTNPKAQAHIALMAMVTAMIATTAEIAVFMNKGLESGLWTKDKFADVAASYFDEAVKSSQTQNQEDQS